MLLGVLPLSEEEAGEVPAALAPGSFRGVCPGVSTLPFIARSLAAALSAEHLFPRMRGSGGNEGVLLVGLLSCEDPTDFLVVLTEDVSLPDSPPVDVLPLFDTFLSELHIRFFPCRLFPLSPSGTCCLCLAERVSLRSFLLSLLSESEEEDEDLERLSRDEAVLCSFAPSSIFFPPSFVFSSPASGVTSIRLFLVGCLFS